MDGADRRIIVALRALDEAESCWAVAGEEAFIVKI